MHPDDSVDTEEFDGKPIVQFSFKHLTSYYTPR